MKRLLAVLVLAAAFIFNGGVVFAQNNRQLVELLVIRAEQEATKCRSEVDRCRLQAPLPALPVPSIMTENGPVQAVAPRPLENFPVAKPQPVVRPQPAIQVPAAKTEKGVVQAPDPRPTTDFPVAKPQQQMPTADIKRSKGFLDGKAVVVNQENIHVNVMLSAPNNFGRKVAIEVKPGEYTLLTGTLNGWEPEKKPLIKEKDVPRGYEIVKGREVKS